MDGFLRKDRLMDMKMNPHTDPDPREPTPPIPNWPLPGPPPTDPNVRAGSWKPDTIQQGKNPGSNP